MKKVQPPTSETFARIRVIGVGGSGKNVTNYMVKTGIPGVEFIVANTDAQDLQYSKAEKKIHLGRKTTQGLGTGMNPELGRSAAEESLTEIHEFLKGSDMVFIACGMGGGTGTGAAPVIAKTALDLGILTIAVITRPFTFEGGKRRSTAEEGLSELAQTTDAMVIIPNDKILAVADDKTTMADAFALSDTVLQQAVSGISQLVMKPGDINIDFADVRVILEDAGTALLGLGTGRGSNRAEVAVTKATSSPLLETSIKGAKRVLFSIASKSRSETSMREVQTIAERITESVDPDAKIIFGTSTDKDLRQGEIRVTLIATAFDQGEEEEEKEEPERKEEKPTVRTVKKKSKKSGQEKVERLSDFTVDDVTATSDIILDEDEEEEEKEKEKEKEKKKKVKSEKKSEKDLSSRWKKILWNDKE